MMACNEMSIIDGKQFDPSTGSELGSIEIPLFKSYEIPYATKSLEFIIGGISSWPKPIVAYIIVLATV